MLDITKPSILQELCEQYRLTPSKGYGQNFLITDAPIKKMIEAAELEESDIVVEIGPGFGILTFALVERVKKVIAFEIEKRLLSYWERVIEDQKIERLKEYKIGRLEDHVIEIIWGNALFGLKTYDVGRRTYKVIANLPYQITSDVLRTLLELENKPEMIVIMVQKEVAERVCARKGEMSLLSVAVQYYGEPKIVAKVPAGSFWPRPKVESAILKIKIEESKNQKINESDDFDKRFFRVVKAGFAQKRKMLWSNLAKGLKIDGERVKAVLREVAGNEKVRAEEVSVGEWKKIVAGLQKM